MVTVRSEDCCITVLCLTVVVGFAPCLHEPNMFIASFVVAGDSDQCCVVRYGNKVRDSLSSEKFPVYNIKHERTRNIICIIQQNSDGTKN